MAERIFNIKRAVKDYIKTLEACGVRVERVILFGSQAKGSAHESSDIDIVVISKDLKRYPYPERLSFLSRATLDIREPLEVLGYTPDEIKNKKGKSILWDEILQTGRTIYKAA